MNKTFNGLLVKIYNFLISRKLLNLNNRVCRRLRQVLLHNICYECNACFGKLNEKKLLYVIRSPKDDLGFFGLFNYVVDHMKYAISLNAEPVVDWKYYPNDYLSEDALVGKENAWNYFFEDTVGITIEEVYHSKNVIMSGRDWLTSYSEVNDSLEIKNSNKIIKTYIKLNKEFEQYINSDYDRIQMDKNRVLGLKCRGTDFIETQPKLHAVQPNIDQIIQAIEDKEKEWGIFDKIFLATEDENIFKKLKLYYKEKLIYCETETRVKSSGGKWLNHYFDSACMKNRKKQAMSEYLREVYLLADCDALIAPVVGGTLGALRISGGFDKVYLFNLGSYN